MDGGLSTYTGGALAFELVKSPEGLTLSTYQRNERARAFYERRGFRAVRYGVSPPPECEPDVEYAWASSEDG